MPDMIRPLTADELDHIDQAMQAFAQLIMDLGLDTDIDDLDTPELADLVIAQWRNTSRQARLKPDILATIVGAAVGDYIKAKLRVEWRFVHDADGEGLVLVGDEKTEEQIIIAPFEAILKRLQSDPDDFVVDFLQGLWEHVSHLERTDSRD